MLCKPAVVIKVVSMVGEYAMGRMLHQRCLEKTTFSHLDILREHGLVSTELGVLSVKRGCGVARAHPCGSAKDIGGF